MTSARATLLGFYEERMKRAAADEAARLTYQNDTAMLGEDWLPDE